LATHNAERGWRHATRVIVLDRGALVYQSPAADTSYEAFREEYRDILAH
jgi:energy-coupling factor transporter ATP-binding protein EcfA2